MGVSDKCFFLYNLIRMFPILKYCKSLCKDGGEFCRALYDYEATAPEELSFFEGQILKLTRRVRLFI